jgi:predicted GNAT family N-acyltransferase/predicted GNAT family acetyltransferase
VSVEVRLAEPADRARLHALRHEVVVLGQGVPVELEQDPRDDTAEHAVALRGGELVGTGRLLLGEDGTGTVGRMAVAAGARRTGIGAALLRRLEDRAVELGLREFELHAQVHAQDFYARAGYRRTSEIYLEAGIEHVTMRRALPVVRDVRDDDGAALVTLIGGCWAEYPGVELHVDAEEPWLRAPASAYRRWGGRMWVVELDGDVVACCGVKPVRDGVVELKSMYVAAPARRRGLARRLEALVLAEARRRGASRVELGSDTRFLDAHVTYAALGYEQLPGERDLQDRSHSFEFPFAKDLRPAGDPLR